MSVTSWFLISSSGTRHRLPREMIFVGRDDCELMLQSRSVDKQHAVINYNPNTDEHMVKDLGSLNGTFVNDLRIPDQTYITLKLSDVIRFGYDAHVYILEKSQHKVPEEALKHEKYTSQLQLGIKSQEAKSKEKQHPQNLERSKDVTSNMKLQDKAERRAQSLTVSTDSPMSRPTPLYGQPSWWGEDEDQANTKLDRSGKMPEQEVPESAEDASKFEVNRSQSDSQAKSVFSYRREPSYFEIPTKELQQGPTKKEESQVHEVPTKDTTHSIPSTPTSSVVQSHASFTIEFDECTPGKMKIKDHVTKFAFRQSRKQLATEVATTPTEVMSSESKVADWLVQSNASMMMRRKSQGENLHGTNSLSSDLKIANANCCENSSRSDSGHPAANGNDFLQSEPQDVVQVSSTTLRTSPDLDETLSRSPTESRSLSSHSKSELQQTFVIEMFDNSRKRHSQTFSNPTASPEPAGLQHRQEKANTSSPAVERHVPPASSSTTPSTQRYTIPLKDSSSSSGFQRAGSLRREKTEDRISTSLSSRSSSASVRPFSSVGRKSKLAKEFTTERLRQEKSSSSWEKYASSSSKAAQRRADAVFQSDRTSTSPPPPDGHHRHQTSSPVSQPVPLKPATMPTQNVEVGSPRNDEEDNLSDAGTYTIEADIQDKEVEEARSKIDQVFGVNSPEPMKPSDAETSSAFRSVIDQDREEYRQSSSGKEMPASEQGHSQVQPAAAGVQGAPKWMSCWASLADSYTESGSSSGLFDMPSQMELAGGARGTIIHKTARSQRQNSSDADDSRARRILPQEERSDLPTPSIHVHCNLNSTFDMENSSSVAPRSQDDVQRLTVQDDVEPDSLSDASKSDDGSNVEHSRKRLTDTEEKLGLALKSTAFYIRSEESKPHGGDLKASSPHPERKLVNRTFSTATLTKQKCFQDSETIRPAASPPVLGHRTQSPESKEAATSSLIRQESFTKDKPSNARLPNISSLPVERDPEPGLFLGGGSHDTHSYLKQTEDVLAVLEAKLQAGQSETTPSPILDSLSGDSDVDTSSTVSQHSSKVKPNSLVTQPAAVGLHSEKFSTNITSQDSNQSEKLGPYGVNSSNKTEIVRKPVGLRRSIGRSGSTDLSDDPHSFPYSDQESSNNQTQRKYTMPLQKEDSKPSKASQVLSRTSSLSAPRPTRASMLRRARLGDASDNEGTESDKLSQEANGAPAKQPQEAKKLSRLDMLAMPRRRAGSFNTASDTEAASTTQWTSRSAGCPSRSTDLSGSSNPRASAGVKPVERPQKAALNKTPATRSRSNSAKYASSTASSRRRQKGSDYTSTSDEEYDSHWTSLKNKRSQPSSASHSPRSQPRPQPVVARHPKSSSRDSEEESHEGEAFHSWSAHSAEIARLSQDLAKDLAILAREIHDVAGDGDPQTAGEEHSAALAPQQQVPQSGPNRVQTSFATKRESDQRSSDHEQSSRHLPRNSDEVSVNSLLLSPVYHVTTAIRGNTEQLVDKIKLLFQDRMDVWEESEAKIKSDSDAAVGTSSNKEVASILKELRSVQKQLEVINAVLEPSGTLEATRASSSSSSSEARSSRAPLSRDWRTVHSVSKRGGGPRPSGSVRRAAVTPDDLREGYVV